MSIGLFLSLLCAGGRESSHNSPRRLPPSHLLFTAAHSFHRARSPRATSEDRRRRMVADLRAGKREERGRSWRSQYQSCLCPCSLIMSVEIKLIAGRRSPLTPSSHRIKMGGQRCPGPGRCNIGWRRGRLRSSPRGLGGDIFDHSSMGAAGFSASFTSTIARLALDWSSWIGPSGRAKSRLTVLSDAYGTSLGA